MPEIKEYFKNERETCFYTRQNDTIKRFMIISEKEINIEIMSYIPEFNNIKTTKQHFNTNLKHFLS